MASKVTIEALKKATRGPASGSESKTAQKANSLHPTKWPAKSDASASREAISDEGMGSKGSKSEGNDDHASSRRSPSPVVVSVATGGSNEEAKLVSDQEARDPLVSSPAPLGVGRSGSSRVRDQIKMIEEKNKDSRPKRPVRRTTTIAESEGTNERKGAGVAYISTVKATLQTTNKRSSSTLGLVSPKKERPPSSIASTMSVEERRALANDVATTGGSVGVPAGRKKLKSSINSLISRFEQQEKKVRQDELLEKVHLRRASIDDYNATPIVSPSVSSPVAKSFTVGKSLLDRRRSSEKETAFETVEECEDSSTQVPVKDTCAADEDVANVDDGEQVAKPKLPPKPGALPPISRVVPKPGALPDLRMPPKPGPLSAGSQVSKPTNDKKEDVEEEDEEFYEDVSETVQQTKADISEPKVVIDVSSPPPTDSPDGELYDDIVDDKKNNEPEQKQNIMRYRPLPCVPDRDSKQNEKGGLFSRFRRRKGQKASKKDGSPHVKRKSKKNEVIQPSFSDEEDDALELKEEDELERDELELKEEDEVDKAHTQMDSDELDDQLYADVDPVVTSKPVETTCDYDQYMTPVGVIPNQVHVQQEGELYDDVEVNAQVPAVIVKSSSPIERQMSPGGTSDQSSSDVYEDVICDDASSLDSKGKSMTPDPATKHSIHPGRLVRYSSEPSDDPNAIGRKSQFARERSQTVPETNVVPLDSSSLDSGARNGHVGSMTAWDTEVIGLADAIWDHVSMESDELTFRQGDVIAITDTTHAEWWIGFTDDSPRGYFPATFVRRRIDEADESMKSGHRSRFSLRRKPKLSQEQVRAKVVEEILSTEEVYVRHLGDITEGYLKRCQENSSLFTPDILQSIFSNIDEIYQFHCDFLTCLKESTVQEKLQDSRIGECFVKNADRFRSYSEYCNNHPDAAAQMAVLQGDMQYRFFFEGCRLLQKMDEISLDGYLLTPVQKICKYPLQLAELGKNTPSDHPDYEMVTQAQTVMANVAEVINERKRCNETLHKIAQWQVKIEDWQGEDMLLGSSELIHSGDIYKISKGHSQERVFFLFDFQLVYCKKELLGDGLQYRGRLNMNNCKVVDLQDGEVTHSGSPVLNAWKMDNVKKNKWYVLYTKNSEDKEKWLRSFEDERERVSKQKSLYVDIPEEKRKEIMNAARTKKASVVKHKGRSMRSSLDNGGETKLTSSSSIRLPDPVSSEDLQDGDGKSKSKRQRGKKNKLFGSKR